MESKVAPIINKYWVEDSFPFELLPAFKDLNLGGLGMQGYGCRGGSTLLTGLVAMEWHRRFDCDIFRRSTACHVQDPHDVSRSAVERERHRRILLMALAET